MKQAMDNQLKIFEKKLNRFTDFIKEIYPNSYAILQRKDELIVAFHDLKEFWEE